MIRSDARPHPAASRRLVRDAALAGLTYFAVVFAIAFCLGATRAVLLEPIVSKLIATLIEAPFLLAAVMWAASWVPRAFSLKGRPWALFAMGLIGLGLQQAADAGLSLTLRGQTLPEAYAQFRTPAGWLLAALLTVYLLAPLMLNARRSSEG